ncbi:MAG: hypothetical protein ACREHD_00025 [Pirellulales bacterium]
MNNGLGGGAEPPMVFHDQFNGSAANVGMPSGPNAMNTTIYGVYVPTGMPLPTPAPGPADPTPYYYKMYWESIKNFLWNLVPPCPPGGTPGQVGL